MNPLVLIVDDDASVCAGLKLVLEMKNYRAETAADAEEALAWIEQSDPALIIVDCQLPGMRGSEAVRRIRDELPDLPILAISAQAETRGEMMLAGSTTFLPKPLDMNELVDEISSLTETARAEN